MSVKYWPWLTFTLLLMQLNPNFLSKNLLYVVTIIITILLLITIIVKTLCMWSPMSSRSARISERFRVPRMFLARAIIITTNIITIVAVNIIEITIIGVGHHLHLRVVAARSLVDRL